MVKGSCQCTVRLDTIGANWPGGVTAGQNNLGLDLRSAGNEGCLGRSVWPGAHYTATPPFTADRGARHEGPFSERRPSWQPPTVLEANVHLGMAAKEEGARTGRTQRSSGAWKAHHAAGADACSMTDLSWALQSTQTWANSMGACMGLAG